MSVPSVTVLVLAGIPAALILAGLQFVRRRAGGETPARPARSPAVDGSPATLPDAGILSILSTPTAQHVHVDSGCVAAHSASVDCGSHGGH